MSYDMIHSDDINKLKENDLFIILLANFFRDYNQDGCIKYLEYLKIKIIELRKKNVKIIWLGCGAQTTIESNLFDIDNKIISLVLDIIKISEIKNIGVRGLFTNKLLNYYNIPNKVLGCPSIFYKEIKVKPKCLTDNIKIVVSPTFGSRIYDEFYKTLKFSIINKTQIYFQSEYNISYNNFTNDELIKNYYEMSNNDKIVKYLHNFNFTLSDFNYIINNNFKVDSVLDWIQKLEKFDFLITSRIHGAICGLLSGIRVLCIVHDSRTKELCDELKIQNIYLQDLNNYNIKELYEKSDQQNFIKNISNQKKKYELFFKEEGIVNC